jgi:hypothetical protein
VRTAGLGGGGGAGGASASTSSTASTGVRSDSQPGPSAIAITTPAWANTDAVTGSSVLSTIHLDISNA